jgi:hypothetical protein
MGKAKKNTAKRRKRGKAGDKRWPTTPEELRRRWAMMGFDDQVRREIAARNPFLERQHYFPAYEPAQLPLPKQPRQYSKRAQEKALRRIREAYPDGVGDTSTADVCRKISDKNYDAKWDSVHRALDRKK